MSVNLNTGKLEKARDVVKSNVYKHICMDEGCCKYKYLPKLKFCCEKKCCVIPNIEVNGIAYNNLNNWLLCLSCVYGEYLIEEKNVQ